MKTKDMRWRYWFLPGLLLSTAAFAPEDKVNHIAAPPAHRVPSDLVETADAAPVEAVTATKAKSPFALTNLPPLPAGVVELKFTEFFRQPVGPRGLELTDKLSGLAGRRVRVLGYMVKQERPVAHRLLLTTVPVTLHEDEYGFCEDMPATVLHVFTATNTPPDVPLTPGLLLLTGTLSVGNREEADGRISTVRLLLDPPAAESSHAGSSSAPEVRRDASVTNSVPVQIEPPGPESPAAAD